VTPFLEDGEVGFCGFDLFGKSLIDQFLRFHHVIVTK
jgi:hypothetical protein